MHTEMKKEVNNKQVKLVVDKNGEIIEQSIKNENKFNSDIEAHNKVKKQELTESDISEMKNELSGAHTKSVVSANVRRLKAKTAEEAMLSDLKAISLHIKQRKITKIERFTLEKLAEKADIKFCFNIPNESYILIRKKKLYIVNKNNEIQTNAIRIIPGFMVELGRDIFEIQEALKVCRVPITIIPVGELGETIIYSVQLQDFGEKAKKDTIAALLVNKANGLIKSIEVSNVSRVYIGKYQLSTLFQVSVSRIPRDRTRLAQVEKILNRVLGKIKVTKINEDKNLIVATYTANNKNYAAKFTRANIDSFKLSCLELLND